MVSIVSTENQCTAYTGTQILVWDKKSLVVHIFDKNEILVATATLNPYKSKVSLLDFTIFTASHIKKERRK